MRKQILLAAGLLVLVLAPSLRAQDKLLTIDDIFDPAKRVNFSGTPSTPRWLKDGVHYIVASKDRSASPRLLKVNALTGKSEPFYDSVKMEAAFAALPGFGKDVAHRLANQSSYQMNPAETAALINHAGDLFYY
ncbi:MAG: dipeptidyl-peptidase 4, partial [Blastocatellia bacterium]|nr:dipeptidyl-peptidase 4 [Blastocatellia bacterium]